MANNYICESVNPVENNFSADSRDKDGHRVVTFDKKRMLNVFLFHAYIVQIESAKDAKSGEDRAIITLASGQRYVAQRSALEICNEITALRE